MTVNLPEVPRSLCINSTSFSWTCFPLQKANIPHWTAQARFGRHLTTRRRGKCYNSVNQNKKNAQYMSMPLLKAQLLHVRKSPEKLRIYRCSHFQTVPVQPLNDLNDSNWLIGSCSKPDSNVLPVLVGILHVGLFAAGNKSHYRSSLPACLQSWTQVTITGMQASTLCSKKWEHHQALQSMCQEEVRRIWEPGFCWSPNCLIGSSFPHHKLKLHLEQDSEFFPAHQQKLGWLGKVKSMIIKDFSNIWKPTCIPNSLNECLLKSK